MDVGGAIWNRLTTDSTVSGLVGDRVYHNLGPIGQWPQISFTIEQEPDEAIDARTLQRFNADISIESLSHAEARAIRDAVKSKLDRQTWSWNSTTIVSVQHSGGDETAVPQDSGNVNRTYFSQELTFSLLAKSS